MNNNRPNIVILKTDQQRADTIAALGHSHMITPNLDRLVREGIAFPNTFCCGATCIASRAAFYTGMFAHNTGCYGFDRWSHNPTWLSDIRDAGYRTAAVGKVHHNPDTAMMAFDQRVFVENFPLMSATHDDYANYLKAEGRESGCKLLTQDGQWLAKCVSDVFPMDEKYHPDQYVGRMAVRWIDDYTGDAPFFLHVGFQGPHDPYDPPARFLDMYRNRPVPAPHVDEGGLDARPPQYRRHMDGAAADTLWDRPPSHGAWAVDLSDKSTEQLLDMRRHYYALITQIDEQVGRILDALERTGRLSNTLILFTSDHGDNLGDHQLMYKWLMTDQAVRVPLLVRLPEGCAAQDAPPGRVDRGLCTQMDIGPTLLTMLGLPVPQRLDGRSNWRRWREDAGDETPDIVYCEDTYLTMVRTATRKLILYAGQPCEEYFDLEHDPREESNLCEEPRCRDEILMLKETTLDWLQCSRYLGSLMHTEPGRPQARRPIWPANHPHDPHALHAGTIKTPQ